MDYSKTFSIALIAVLITVNMVTAPSVSDSGKDNKTRPGLGIASCHYLGNADEACTDEPFIQVSSLPQECTSFVYHSINSDNLRDLINTRVSSDKTDHIQNITNSGKPAFVFYGRSNIETWINDVLGTNVMTNIKNEMDNLKTYLAKYPKLSGLIIENIQYSEFTTNFTGISENFNLYLKEMRSNFPNYGIGLSLVASTFINYYNVQEDFYNWLKFNELDENIDFYVFKLFNFNKCSQDLSKTGTTLLNHPEKNSLIQLVNFAKKAGIPESKIHFEFYLGVKSIHTNVSSCSLTNTKRCALPNLDGLCADSPQTFYEKGKFTEKYTAGFVAMELDLVDDPNGSCGCGNYPAFHYILNGFNKAAEPTPCDKFDKISK